MAAIVLEVPVYGVPMYGFPSFY